MAYGVSNDRVTDDVMWPPKVLLGSTVGYPSDSLTSCLYMVFVTFETLQEGGNRIRVSDDRIRVQSSSVLLLEACCCCYYMSPINAHYMPAGHLRSSAIPLHGTRLFKI